MKFRMNVKNIGESDSSARWENYEKAIDDPQKWADNCIESFNRTLRPNEKPREVIAVEVLGDELNEELHSWEKYTSGMSVQFRGRCTDMMYCSKCGITGKKFSLSSTIKIDSKYRKKAFQKCNTSIAKLRAQSKTEETP